jgi:hypothetical protein
MNRVKKNKCDCFFPGGGQFCKLHSAASDLLKAAKLGLELFLQTPGMARSWQAIEIQEAILKAGEIPNGLGPAGEVKP